MENKNPQWEELGRTVRDIVDQAVSSQDYRKLNQTVRQTVSRAVDLGSETVRKVMDSKSQERPKIIEQQDVTQLYGGTGHITAKGVVKIVGGGLLAGVMVLILLVSLAMMMITERSVVLLLSGLLGFGGGGLLIGSGIGNLNMVSRFKIYKKTLGNKTYCTIEKLSKSTGRSVKFVRKELQKIIGQGLLPEGHLNNEQTMLITSHATYR